MSQQPPVPPRPEQPPPFPPRQLDRIPVPPPESLEPAGRPVRASRPDAESTVPGWWGDVRRMLIYAACSAILWTAVLWLAGFGILRHNGRQVELDVVLVGVLAGAPGLAWPFLQFAPRRPDHGFRLRGLPVLMLLTIPAGALIHLAAMLLWPLIAGGRAVPGTVAAELHRDPAALALVFVFLVAGMSWFSVIVQVMIRWPVKGALICLLPFLGAVFLFMFSGVRIFENPPAGQALLVWSVAAVAGLAAVCAVSALFSRRKA